VELAPATAVVCSLDFEDSLEDASFTAYPRTASLRFEPSGAAILTTMPKPGGGVVGSASSRFAFSVSDNALKPWYLSTTPAAVPLANPRSVVPSSSPSLVGASPLSARSFSFASPAARSTRVPPTPSAAAKAHNKAPTPAPAPLSTPPPQQQFPRTPRPSFLQSPFTFRKDGQGVRRVERERDSFLPFLRFYRRPYDEISYRARMRPPLGGLIAIVDDKFRHKPAQQQQQPRRHAAVLHHHHQYQQHHHHHHNHQHQRI
jgi:hypothetical protein